MKKNQPMIEQINNFLNSTEGRKWLSDGIIKLYVRKSKRQVNGNLYSFLDLASIEVINKKDRGKGIFTNFLKELLQLYSDKNIFIESILNFQLIYFFERFGFKIKENSEYQFDMFLIKK